MTFDVVIAAVGVIIVIDFIARVIVIAVYIDSINFAPCLNFRTGIS